MDQPNYQPPEPFQASFEGYVEMPDDVANTVTVSATTYYELNVPDQEDEDCEFYADAAGARELVTIDTNYKPTRPGAHPVHLHRTDAIRLAAALIDAAHKTPSTRSVAGSCRRPKPLRSSARAKLSTKGFSTYVHTLSLTSLLTSTRMCRTRQIGR